MKKNVVKARGGKMMEVTKARGGKMVEMAKKGKMMKGKKKKAKKKKGKKRGYCQLTLQQLALI